MPPGTALRDLPRTCDVSAARAVSRLPGVGRAPGRVRAPARHRGLEFPRKVPGKKIDKATGKPVLLDTKITNVRNYTSPFWKSAMANPERRCLVPFTSFSEYGPGPAGKRPLFWFDVPSRPIVSFAGVWRPTDNGAVFAFLTTEPNPLVEPIHPKVMPVLLDEEDEESWLTCSFDQAVAHARPFPSQLMSVQQAQDPREVIGEGEQDAKSDQKADQPSFNL